LKFTDKKKVYVHDTDLTRTMYYAKYLEWFEEVRIDLLEKKYKPLKQMIVEDGISFVHTESTVRYKRPLFLGDEVVVGCDIIDYSKATITMYCTIKKEEVLTTTSTIILTCINADKGNATRIPERLVKILEKEVNK